MALTPKQLKTLRETRIGAAGNRLQAAIDLAEETQSSVARALDFPISYVSDTARGRHHTMRLDNAYRFAEFFGCAIEDLFPSREAMTA